MRANHQAWTDLNVLLVFKMDLAACILSYEALLDTSDLESWNSFVSAGKRTACQVWKSYSKASFQFVIKYAHRGDMTCSHERSGEICCSVSVVGNVLW